MQNVVQSVQDQTRIIEWLENIVVQGDPVGQEILSTLYETSSLEQCPSISTFSWALDIEDRYGSRWLRDGNSGQFDTCRLFPMAKGCDMTLLSHQTNMEAVPYLLY